MLDGILVGFDMALLDFYLETMSVVFKKYN